MGKLTEYYIISSDLTEGTVNPASLPFTTLNWNIPQTVTVTGVDDPDLDGNIAYTIQTGPASSDADRRPLGQPRRPHGRACRTGNKDVK